MTNANGWCIQPKKVIFLLRCIVGLKDQNFSKSNLQGFLAIVRDWAIIVGAVACGVYFDNIAITLVCIWLIGSQQYALGEVLVHEAAHRNLFARRSWNRSLQFLFAWPLLSTVENYTSYHFDHHRHYGKERDPLLPVYKNLGKNLNPFKVLKFWLLEPLFGICGYRLVRDEIMGNNLKTLFPGLVINACVLAVCLFYGIADYFLIYWVVPYFWCFSSFFHWQEIEDHFLCEGVGRVSLGKVRGFLHHNTGYHVVHHMMPGVPFFHLQRAYALVAVPESDKSKGFWHTFFMFLERSR